MHGNKKYSESLKKKALDYYFSHTEPKGKVSLKFNLGEHTITNWITKDPELSKRQAEKMKDKSLRTALNIKLIYSDEVKQNAIQKVKEGKSVIAVANEIGCAPVTVKTWMNEDTHEATDDFISSLVPELKEIKLKMKEKLSKEYYRLQEIIRDADVKSIAIYNELQNFEDV